MPTPARLARVIVATDFSVASRRALERAARLPFARQALLLLVHVVEGAPRDRAARHAIEELRRRLEREAVRAGTLARHRGHATLRIGAVLLEGRPSQRIVKLAARRRADLIVVGGHGRRTVRDLLLGTTARRVVRQSPVPVLVVRRPVPGPYRRPLIATDLEPPGPAVARSALRLLEPSVRDVTLLHAAHVPFEGWIINGGVGAARQVYRKVALREAAERLDGLLSKLGEAAARLRPKLRYGDPRVVIATVAGRRRADLVAVGSHGRRGLAGMVLGRVAEWAVQVLPCDVLVVKGGGAGGGR